MVLRGFLSIFLSFLLPFLSFSFFFLLGEGVGWVGGGPVFLNAGSSLHVEVSKTVNDGMVHTKH